MHGVLDGHFDHAFNTVFLWAVCVCVVIWNIPIKASNMELSIPIGDDFPFPI